MGIQGGGTGQTKEKEQLKVRKWGSRGRGAHGNNGEAVSEVKGKACDASTFYQGGKPLKEHL